MPAFDFGAFLDLARDLEGHGTDAARRSAVSRAYYAAYHRARRHIEKTDPGYRLTKTGDDHTLVWEFFREKQDKELRWVNQTGLRLKESRRDADYAPSRTFVDGQVADAIRLAARIISIVSGSSPAAT